MREYRLRTLWRDKLPAINGWLTVPSGVSAETMAHQGYDSLTIDMQHGLIDYQAMLSMLQAISTTPTVPIVRVQWLEAGILMKALDAGAYGVICPMINTRADAQKLVARTHYAPRGTRSFGPTRASLCGGLDYAQHADDTIVTFAMIETAQALDNLDSILSVEGLDAIYIGPSDLSLALGGKPAFEDHQPNRTGIDAQDPPTLIPNQKHLRSDLADAGTVVETPVTARQSPDKDNRMEAAMKGDPKVIEYLNAELKNELTAINQYFLHCRMLKHWGFARMAKHEYEESIGEMKHADTLIERILVLEGLPNLQDLGKLLIGENPVEILSCDLQAERAAQATLKDAIAHCESVRDYVSRELLDDILDGTEEHIDHLETQTELVGKVGEQNWLQSQMGEGASS
jgi:4-hydroxy-2-oxoheptanedioate aldolase